MGAASAVQPAVAGRLARPRRGIGLIALYVLTAAALVVLTLFPMLWLLIGSLQEPGGGMGLSNFVELNEKFAFAAVLVNSWVFAFGSATAATLLGVLLAVLVARTDAPFRKAARMSAILAFVSPPWLTATSLAVSSVSLSW